MTFCSLRGPRLRAFCAAPSALADLDSHYTWAADPGCHITRLWRSQKAEQRGFCPLLPQPNILPNTAAAAIPNNRKIRNRVIAVPHAADELTLYPPLRRPVADNHRR